MAITGISGFNPLSSSFMDTGSIQQGNNESVKFSDYLKDALDKVNTLQLESDRVTDDFAAGRTDNIHQVMIAAEKADVALQFTMQIRNKILDAYSEILRMQI